MVMFRRGCPNPRQAGSHGNRPPARCSCPSATSPDTCFSTIAKSAFILCPARGRWTYAPSFSVRCSGRCFTPDRSSCCTPAQFRPNAAPCCSRPQRAGKSMLLGAFLQRGYAMLSDDKAGIVLDDGRRTRSCRAFHNPTGRRCGEGVAVSVTAATPAQSGQMHRPSPGSRRRPEATRVLLGAHNRRTSVWNASSGWIGFSC